MGTKLGHSPLSLDLDARQQFSMVARTGARYPRDLPSIPDRSRPGILSRLRFSLAAAEEQRIPAARAASDAGADWRTRSALRSTRRWHTPTLQRQRARR